MCKPCVSNYPVVIVTGEELLSTNSRFNTQTLPKIFKESSMQLWPGLLDVDQHVGVGAMPGGHHLFPFPAKIVINCFFFGATGHNIIIKLTPFTITFRINKYNIVSTMVISTEKHKKIFRLWTKIIHCISTTDILF